MVSRLLRHAQGQTLAEFLSPQATGAESPQATGGQHQVFTIRL